jgi:hypothetical protein
VASPGGSQSPEVERPEFGDIQDATLSLTLSLFLDRQEFPASFAADVSPREAAFMADLQVPWGVDALAGTVSDPRLAKPAELVPDRDR